MGKDVNMFTHANKEKQSDKHKCPYLQRPKKKILDLSWKHILFQFSISDDLS